MFGFDLVHIEAQSITCDGMMNLSEGAKSDQVPFEGARQETFRTSAHRLSLD